MTLGTSNCPGLPTPTRASVASRCAAALRLPISKTSFPTNDIVDDDGRPNIIYMVSRCELNGRVLVGKTLKDKRRRRIKATQVKKVATRLFQTTTMASEASGKIPGVAHVYFYFVLYM